MKLDPPTSRALFDSLLNLFDRGDSANSKPCDEVLEYPDGLHLSVHQDASIINADYN